MAVEEFAVVGDRDLRPLLDKLAQHGASAVFSRVQDRTVAHVRMPQDERDAELCRQIIEEWNNGP
jgi:hypothetical protein